MRKIDRYAGRIIPITINGDVLLIKGHDIDSEDYSWWFTIGGGIKSKETFRQCATREFYEETNIFIDSKILVEPFIVRYGKFDFSTHTIYQKEFIYLVLFKEKFMPNTANFTLQEKKVIDEIKWWDINELINSVQEKEILLFPKGLEKIIKEVYLNEKKDIFSIASNKKYDVLNKTITYNIDDVLGIIKRIK